MDLKKKFRDFFTMTRKGDGGFTLVELIVVIAILAILGGVAVPAYSGYVKKANMQADISLASEVAHALSLYYYSHPGTEGGYVILKPNGEIAGFDGTSMEDSVGAAAMQAVFGDGWQQTATLKYGEWGGADLLNEVANYSPTELETIANSTFLTHGTTAGMMNTVNDLLGMAAGEIAGSNIAANLDKLGITTFSDALKGVDKDDQGTVVANLLVGYYADAIDKASEEGKDPTDDPIVNLMYTYANAYAYSEYCGDGADNAYLQAVETEIKNAANDSSGGLTALQKLGSKTTDWESRVGTDVIESFWEFEDKGYVKNNNNALTDMMGAISSVANANTDKDDLVNPNLYASESVANQMKAYVNAIKAAMNGNTIPGLQAGEVIIMLYEDGLVYTSIDTVA